MELKVPYSVYTEKRRQVIYRELRKDIVAILRTLSERKGG